MCTHSFRKCDCSRNRNDFTRVPRIFPRKYSKNNKMSTKVPLVDMSDYDGQGCLDQMFRNQAKATPDAVAVVNIDGSVVGFINIIIILYLFFMISVSFSIFILSNFFNFRSPLGNWTK